MPTRSAIAAIVLAAGRSSRMGEPKPLLLVDGRPLLSRVLGAVEESRVGEVVVVLGHEADRVQSVVAMGRARGVLNPNPDEGMSSSLRVGLHASTAEACLVVLGDQPFLQSATLDAIIDEYTQSPGDILVPTFRGRRGNPVLLRRTVWPEVETLKGDLGFRAVFGKHAKDLREIRVDDPGVLIDIDTPQDLERIRRAREEGRPLESLV